METRRVVQGKEQRVCGGGDEERGDRGEMVRRKEERVEEEWCKAEFTRVRERSHENIYGYEE